MDRALHKPQEKRKSQLSYRYTQQASAATRHTKVPKSPHNNVIFMDIRNCFLPVSLLVRQARSDKF